MTQDWQKIIKENFLDKREELYKMGHTWTALEMKAICHVLFFGDRYWSPKYDTVSNEEECKKFIGLWFWFQRRDIKRTFDAGAFTEEEWKGMNQDLLDSEQLIYQWIDKAINKDTKKKR